MKVTTNFFLPILTGQNPCLYIIDHWNPINSKEFNLFMVRDGFIYKKGRFFIGENAHN